MKTLCVFLLGSICLLQGCNLSNGNSVTAQLPVNISRENSNQNVLNRNASKIEANGISTTEGMRRWIPPVFLGLHVGSSKRSDVIRLLGKPKSEVANFPEDQVYLEDKETEIILDYDNPEKIEGSVVIIIGKESKVVKAISLYPNNQPNLNEFIAKYGSNFFQMRSGDWSNCIDKDQKAGFIDEKAKYPLNLVYPNLGLFADVRNDENESNLSKARITRIDYLMKCE